MTSDANGVGSIVFDFAFVFCGDTTDSVVWSGVVGAVVMGIKVGVIAGVIADVNGGFIGGVIAGEVATFLLPPDRNCQRMQPAVIAKSTAAAATRGLKFILGFSSADCGNGLELATGLRLVDVGRPATLGVSEYGWTALSLPASISLRSWLTSSML